MGIKRKSIVLVPPSSGYAAQGPWNRYVAKIIFTYILGYKVDVGHMEAVNLISSPKYSEKQIVRTLLTNAPQNPYPNHPLRGVLG